MKPIFATILVLGLVVAANKPEPIVHKPAAKSIVTPAPAPMVTPAPQAPPQEAPAVSRPAPVSTPTLPAKSGGAKQSQRPASREAKAPVVRAAGYWRNEYYGFRGRRVRRVWVSTQPRQVQQQRSVPVKAYYCPPGSGT